MRARSSQKALLEVDNLPLKEKMWASQGLVKNALLRLYLSDYFRASAK